MKPPLSHETTVVGARIMAGIAGDALYRVVCSE